MKFVGSLLAAGIFIEKNLLLKVLVYNLVAFAFKKKSYTKD
jgi:hypothetical protein